jgi:serum/glucocorticoid-regulated kinase 2
MLFPHSPSPSGVLSVTIHEGVGFSALDQSQELSLTREHKNENFVHSTWGIYSPLPYSLFDYEKSQILVPSILGTTENPRWPDRAATCKFNIARATDLTTHLYLQYLGAEKSFQHVRLGVITLNLFQGMTALGSQPFLVGGRCSWEWS